MTETFQPSTKTVQLKSPYSRSLPDVCTAKNAVKAKARTGIPWGGGRLWPYQRFPVQHGDSTGQRLA
eukprot:1598395-Rhodomonas_salina.4